MSQEQSFGSKRVRVGFNPGKHNLVDLIKIKTADLIDTIEELKKGKHDVVDSTDEFLRLASLAQTSFEEGAMWAVKAATSPLKEV